LRKAKLQSSGLWIQHQVARDEARMVRYSQQFTWQAMLMAKTTTAPRVRTIPFRWGILLLLLTVLQHFSSASNPTHRYSFTSNADDSNGGAHGTVLGNA